MSIGAIFTMITNTTVEDKHFMQMDLLKNRITAIAKNKEAVWLNSHPKSQPPSIQDIIPSISEIEQTHIIFTNGNFKPYVSCAHQYMKSLSLGDTAKFGNTVMFNCPRVGDYLTDPVVHIRLEGLKANDARDRVRMVEYIGHRMFKSTRIKYNGREIDSYNSERYNIHYQYKVPVNKDQGYLRSIGQEIPTVGYLTPFPTVDEYREYKYIGNGYQTFKNSHPVIELWVPLLFWFRDLKTALPNFVLDDSALSIEIDLESTDNLIAYNDYSGNPTPIYTEPKFTVCELYTSHIFMDHLVMNIISSKFHYQLIRVNKTQHETYVTNPNDRIKLVKVQWPVETLYVGFRLLSTKNTNQWYKNTSLVPKSYLTAIANGDGLAANSVSYFEEQPLISKIGLFIDDIEIFPFEHAELYSSYMPTYYGQYTLKTPKDMGWYMMNFNFLCGEHQPSGYFNTTQQRMIELKYSSNLDQTTGLPFISASTPVEINIVADCLNFLIPSNELGLRLRYL